MTDTPNPLGLLIQPQAPLGRVVVATMQGPLMVAAITYDDPAHLDAIIGQLVAARVLVYGEPQAALQPAGEARTWACKLGDDCTCHPAPFLDTDACQNFQGPRS